MATPLATAFVRLRPDTSTFEAEAKKDLTKAGRNLAKDSEQHGRRMGMGMSKSLGGGFRAGIGGAAKTMFAPIVAAAAAVGTFQFFKGTIKEASDLGESLNALNVVFGKNAEAIGQLGKEAAESVGLSRVQFNGLAVQFSNFAKTVAGKGGDVVGTMDDLTTRAADFASVMNIDVNEAARLFQSGLAGETEPLRKFGIDLSAAAVQAFAVKEGLVEAGETMTEQEKVQARYGLLMKATAQTQGDFANTSGSLANQQRILKARFADVQAELGQRLLPIITKIVTWVSNNLPKAFEFGSRAVRALVAAFREGDVTSSGFIGVMERIGVVLRHMWLGLKALIAAFKEGDVTSNGFVGIMERVGVALRAIYEFIKNQVVPVLADMGRTIVRNKDFFIPFVAILGAALVAFKAFMFIKTVTAAVWAFNAALAANPIGIVIIAIAALVAALIYAYKHSETFRRIVQATWRAIQAAASFAWNQVLKPIFERIIGAQDRWAERFNTVKNLIGKAWQWLRDHVFTPIGNAVDSVGRAFTRFRDNVGAVWTAIKLAAVKAAQWLRIHVWNPIKSALDTIKAAWAGVKAGFEAGIKSVPGLGLLGGGGGRGGIASNLLTGAGRVFPLPPGSYSWGRGPAAHGYDAQDLPVPTGTAVRAPVAGFAQGINLGNRSYGKYVQIASSRYGRVILAHLSRLLVGSGFVRAGQLVGLSGSTGNSTGPHLHVEPSRILSFDGGGWLPKGLSLAYNGTGQPERVIAPQQNYAGDTITIVAPMREQILQLERWQQRRKLARLRMAT